MSARFVLVGSSWGAGGILLALMDSWFKAGIILSAALVAAVCMRKSSAAGRHMLWAGALFVALLLPLGHRLLPQWSALPPWMAWEEVPEWFAERNPETSNAIPAEITDSEPILTEHESRSEMPVKYNPPPTVRSAGPVVVPSSIRLPAFWFLGAWILGAILSVLPMLASVHALWRLKRSSISIKKGRLAEALEHVKAELGVKRCIRLFSGSPDAMPMVWGVFRLHLLLPSSAVDWSDERLRSVLLHEVAHLRRNDPLFLWIGHFALILHWFNPLAWHAMRSLRAEQESACDDLVLRHGVRSSDYAGEMLAITRSQNCRGIGIGALNMARTAGFEARISAILDSTRNRHPVSKARFVSVALVFACAVPPLAMLRAGESSKGIRGRLLDRDGTVLADNPAGGDRVYHFKSLAGHVLGYGTRDKDAWTGKSGVEKLFDETLVNGKDVSLTLDVGIQSSVETVMRDSGVARGAVVILDCANGDLLASASLPAYDPNGFVPAIPMDRLKTLNHDESMPLLNRALAAYTPGSAFKLLTAMAACRAGDAGDIHACDGFVEIGDRRISCWIWNRDRKTHGNLDLHHALMQSCNCYFIQSAERIGIGSINESGRLLGLGEGGTGCGLAGDNSGCTGEAEFASKRDPAWRWTPGDTANIALGQGVALATPLQLAVLAAAVGNGEKVWVPRLNKDERPRFRTDLVECGWKPADLAVIREAMRDNVMKNGGTGAAARSDKLEIAGLTGTAQTMRRGERDLNAWFTGFAPASEPRFAIVVMVEGGESGGKVCGPIARGILEAICASTPDSKAPDTGN